jgi:secondary thiamine-phosphate synthase enzyme
MDTLSLAHTCRHTRFRLVTTRPTDFVDLTDRLSRFLAEARVETGFVNVQTAHTTTAVIVNESEPLLLEDFRDLLERAAPRAATYRHDDLARRHDVPADEPRNGHAHCRALQLPTSACLNVIAGRLALGRWQRVFLLDLDGPRTREVSVVLIGAGR